MIKLNLISPTQQNLLKLKSLYYSIENLFGLIIVYLTIAAIALIQVDHVLSDFDKQIQRKEEENKKVHQALNQEISLFNNTVNTFEKINSSNYDWLGLINALSQLVPTGVSLTNFNAVYGERTITISGFAKTRDDYLKFKDDLLNSGKFSNLEAPLTDILKKTDLAFTIKAKFN